VEKSVRVRVPPPAPTPSLGTSVHRGPERPAEQTVVESTLARRFPVFDDPDNATLKDLIVKVRGDAAHVTVPRQAVVALELLIA
jgi:hypothetical protein